MLKNTLLSLILALVLLCSTQADSVAQQVPTSNQKSPRLRGVLNHQEDSGHRSLSMPFPTDIDELMEFIDNELIRFGFNPYYNRGRRALSMPFPTDLDDLMEFLNNELIRLGFGPLSVDQKLGPSGRRALGALPPKIQRMLDDFNNELIRLGLGPLF